MNIGPIQVLSPCAHLTLPPPVPTHRLELGLLCRRCSSRHLQMTQRLTHLLCTHTHTHAASSTCRTKGGLRSAETMCSDPARTHPLHIQHTLTEPPQSLHRDLRAHPLSPVMFVCPSACLLITLSSFHPPLTFSHTPP